MVFLKMSVFKVSVRLRMRSAKNCATQLLFTLQCAVSFLLLEVFIVEISLFFKKHTDSRYKYVKELRCLKGPCSVSCTVFASKYKLLNCFKFLKASALIVDRKLFLIYKVFVWLMCSKVFTLIVSKVPEKVAR